MATDLAGLATAMAAMPVADRLGRRACALPSRVSGDAGCGAAVGAELPAPAAG